MAVGTLMGKKKETRHTVFLPSEENQRRGMVERFFMPEWYGNTMEPTVIGQSQQTRTAKDSYYV
jgi:hypothetical protein